MKRVVVTGLGAVTPVGNDIPTFWENLSNGVSGIGLIHHFDTADYKAKVAAEVKDFDITRYVDKMAAKRLDLFSQYAVSAAQQAMEDSGLACDPERLGVYIGSGIGGLSTMVREEEKLLKSGPHRVSPMTIPMMIANLAAGNVAIRFNAQGPCLPVVTACATGTNAIGEAYRTIAGGWADAILAGGTEASITTLGVAAFTACMALTQNDDPKTACRPFDKRRDGFVMGEGAGVLVLEEYEHAKARGAKIYAEVAGYGHTCDAHHVTAPDPEAKGASRSIHQALEQAGHAAGERVYYNAHGTSTPLNDASETLAVKLAFGEEEAHRIFISSTKSMTGHMLGAAGAVEAIASILALDNSLLPPTIGYGEPDPECDLDYIPNTARKAEIDLAVSASLGFGGHNACLAFRKVR
ncbi:3-oxoacyl-[acyl-carrier-protein] synthase II [Ruminococcaceae bacterium D5]|nr:3-oxoacyl-[acyl-carrier-protein] synthase II [Ruminococcaceae bacterium D5]